MDNNQNPVSTTPEVSDSTSGVSFPTVGQPKKSSPAKTLLIIGIIVLVGILGYIIFQNSSAENENEDLIPATSTEESFATSEPTATATAKPADKSKIKVEVQNGTGITGEAAFLQEELKKLGYTTVTVGNASDQNQTKTTVTYARSLATSLSDELTARLKELYKEVEVKTSSTATTDIVIVTGLRKGATAKPAATATPRASATGTARPSASASASPSTPTATP